MKRANPVAMRRYDGLKHRDDENDAAYLAQWLRLGILPTGYLHPPAERALRDLARKRVQWVRMRTQQRLSVENLQAREFGARLSRAEAKRFLDRKKAQTNQVIATKALAHKRARASYHLRKERRCFDVKRCFG